MEPSLKLSLGALHPDDVQRADDQLKSVLDHGMGYDSQFRILHADGAVRHVHAQGKVERDEQGQARRMVGTVLDITDFRLAEEALVAQDTRFRSLINRSTEVIVLLRADTSIAYLSPSFEKVLGFAPANWIDHPLADLVCPGDVGRVNEFHARGLVTPKVPIPFQLRVRHADGTFRWLEGTGSNYVGDPTTDGVVINCRDITERVAAEASLRTKDAAIATALTAIAIADATGRIVYVNPAFVRMWAYADASEVVGTNLRMLGDQSTMDSALDRVARSGSWQGEKVATRKDGVAFPALFSLSSIVDTNGMLLNVMASVLDLSEAKELEGHLLQAQKLELVGELAGGVAHDFNNLLTVILGQTSFAISMVEPADPLRPRLLAIEKAAESAATVTRQLLTFSRRQVVDPRVVQLSAVVAGIEHVLRRLLGETIALHVRAAPDLWTATVDPGQVEQVLVNLVVNARDSMPAAGQVTIETANVVLADEYVRTHPSVMPGDFVLLRVRDVGTGMSPEVQTHIFEPFFTTKAPGSGSGLGLATVDGVVRQHSGHIDVESEVGRGTTVTVYFPRNRTRATPEWPVAAVTPNAGSETVVVVEDEDALRELSETVLTRLGYRVRAFPGGAQALAATSDVNERVDLLLTDVVLGGMSGRVLAERMRERRPDLKVLFTSGYTEDVIVRHGVLSGTMAFIAKPYSIDSLASRVRAVLDAAA